MPSAIGLSFRDPLAYPLVERSRGRHILGGKALHRGSTPSGSNVPLHKLLTIDLADTSISLSSAEIRYLPLYYPLKYGSGGSSVQYSVISENEMQIIYLSHPDPDDAGREYVKVEFFGETACAALPALRDDEDVDWFTVSVGGKPALDHLSDQCQNSGCPNFKAHPDVDLIASVPPGKGEEWWEFSGAYMYFYFWYCRGCQTIIAANRST